MATILTQPLGSPSSFSGTVTPNITVLGISSAPDNSVVVDSVPESQYMSIKWIYTLVDHTTNKVVSAEVLVSHRQNTDPSHTRYSVIGDMLQHTVSVEVIDGNLSLVVTNLQEPTLTATVVRIDVVV